MRTFNFTLLAVASFVAMIGATPHMIRANDGASVSGSAAGIKYVHLTTSVTSRGGSDPIVNVFSVLCPLTAISILMTRNVKGFVPSPKLRSICATSAWTTLPSRSAWTGL